MPYQINILGDYWCSPFANHIFKTKADSEELAIFFMYRQLELAGYMNTEIKTMYRNWCDSQISSTEVMITRLQNGTNEHNLNQVVIIKIKNGYLQNRKAKKRAKKRKHYSKCLIK